MKIGFFTDSYLPSPDGVATSVESSAKELHKLGHDVYIVAPNQPHAKDRKNIYRLLSVKIVQSPEIWLALEVPQPALFKIANLEFDIIHGHSGGTISVLGWQLAQLHGIPFVETYHTLWKYYKHYFFYPKLMKDWLINKMIGKAGNECDAFITPSLKAKNDLIRDGVKKPIYIVPNGLSLHSFSNQKKGFLRNMFQIPASKKILLTVGRLNKEKSIDFLINSFAQVKKYLPELVFVIIGNGQKKVALQQLAASLGVADDVLFAGSIEYEKMPQAYTDSDLFIFASRTETQGMVIIEAFASGVPVVAVEDAAFESVVVNDRNGYVVPKEPNEFAKKIQYILKNNSVKNSLAQNAKQTAQQYAIADTTRVLEQVYKEVIFTYELDRNAKNQLPAQQKRNVLSFMGLTRSISHEYKSFSDLLEQLKQ